MKLKQRLETTLSIVQPVIPFLYKVSVHTTVKSGVMFRVSISLIVQPVILFPFKASVNTAVKSNVIFRISTNCAIV